MNNVQWALGLLGEDKPRKVTRSRNRHFWTRRSLSRDELKQSQGEADEHKCCIHLKSVWLEGRLIEWPLQFTVLWPMVWLHTTRKGCIYQDSKNMHAHNISIKLLSGGSFRPGRATHRWHMYTFSFSFWSHVFPSFFFPLFQFSVVPVLLILSESASLIDCHQVQGYVFVLERAWGDEGGRCRSSLAGAVSR